MMWFPPLVAFTAITLSAVMPSLYVEAMDSRTAFEPCSDVRANGVERRSEKIFRVVSGSVESFVISSNDRYGVALPPIIVFALSLWRYLYSANSVGFRFAWDFDIFGEVVFVYRKCWINRVSK